MERPPARIELVRERQRRTKEAHLRRHDRHAHSPQAHPNVPRMHQMHPAAPFVSSSSAISAYAPSHAPQGLSRRDATSASTESSTIPIAQLVVSAALLTISNAAVTTTTTTSTSYSTLSVTTDIAADSTSPTSMGTTPQSAAIPTSASAYNTSSIVPSTGRVSAAAAVGLTLSNSTLTASSTSISSSTTSTSTRTTSSPLTTSTYTSDGIVLVAVYDSQTTFLSTVTSGITSSTISTDTSLPVTQPTQMADPAVLVTSQPSSSRAVVTDASSSGSSATPTSDAAMIQAEHSQSSVPTPTVVGSVIGSVAGLSLVLVILLFFFRRIKKKRKQDLTSRAIPANDNDDNHAHTHRFINSSDGPHLSARPFTGAAAVTGNMARRFSRRNSPATIEPATPQMTEQRGFERVAGRKLPSQFSPGAVGPAGASNYPSGSSHYGSILTATSSATHDDPFADSPYTDYPTSPPRAPVPSTAAGVIRAASTQRSLGDFTPIQSGQEVYQPGPQRTPVIQQVPTAPNFSMPYLAAPAPIPRNRSATPDSRSSRFQEDFA